MRITSIEIYGFGKYYVPFVINIEDNNVIVGKAGSGKTVLLKSIAYFFDDVYASECYPIISCDNAYVKVSFVINNRIFWIKKVVVNKKSKSIKSEFVYSDNIIDDDLLAVEKVSVLYFNNEKYYSEKEEEIKRVELLGLRYFKDNLLDSFSAFENEVMLLKDKFKEEKDIELDVQFDWNKLFCIDAIEKEKIANYLSTSERKSLLIEFLLRSVDCNSLILIDDFDMYFDRTQYDYFIRKIIDKSWCSIVVVSKYFDENVKVVDYRSNLSVMDYIDKYLK